MRITLLSLLISTSLLSACSGSQAPAKTSANNSANNVVQVTAPVSNEFTIDDLQIAFPLEQRTPEQFPAYVELLKNKVRQQGISEKTLNRGFANLHFIERVIKSDRNQPEKKVMLDDYLKRIVTQSRVNSGISQYNEHANLLDKTSERFGVPPEYIVALWGLESGFGKVQGKEDVVSALATLAFEGRRELLFSKQLMAALQIIEQGYIAPDAQLKGSWAGAMGQNQFMPTSYLAYAIDGDGDGIIDIWTNKADVFASTANYLATEGWIPELPWGYQVQLPVGFETSLEGVKQAQGKTVAQWEALGVKLPGLAKLSPDTRTWLVIPDDNLGRKYLVTQNFLTIMHWNRSYFFALSVTSMADSIGAQIR